MQSRLFVSVIVALWAWVLPIAHAMPIDADGPSGLCDNVDFDDLIVSLTSPSAAVTPPPAVITAAYFAIEGVVPPKRIPVRYVVVRSSVQSRASPVA